MAQTSQEWKEELCKALGLDPAAVTRIELTLPAERPVTMTVTMHPNKSEAVVAALREAGKYVGHVTIKNE